MSGRLIGLPHGWEFDPSDADLVNEYLDTDLKKSLLPFNIIYPGDAYGAAPDDLTRNRLPNSKFDGKKYCWLFSGKRRSASRSAGNGRWKIVTQIDIGRTGFRRSTLEYFTGAGGTYKNGQRSAWKMHEYYHEDEPIGESIWRVYKFSHGKEQDSEHLVEVRSSAVGQMQNAANLRSGVKEKASEDVTGQKLVSAQSSRSEFERRATEKNALYQFGRGIVPVPPEPVLYLFGERIHSGSQ